MPASDCPKFGQTGSNFNIYESMCTGNDQGNYNFSSNLCEKCNNFMDSSGFINPNTMPECINDFNTFCNDATNASHPGCINIKQMIAAENQAAQYATLSDSGITVTMTDDVSEDPTSGPSVSKPPCRFGEHLCKCVEKNMNGESVSSVFFGDSTKPPLQGSKKL